MGSEMCIRDSHYVGLPELEELVRVRGLNGIPTGGIAKHAVAGHLDIDGVRPAVSEGVGEDPLNAFAAAGETLKRPAIFRPHHPLVIGVPV